MFRTRFPRPKRSLLFAVTLTALLAFPTGIVLAAHFNDVPNSSPFHGDIQAIADAGVTVGCGGGNYCPKDNVNREQMAAFMNRLGALGPGKVPVVNADRLDGRHANELTRVAGSSGAFSTVAVTASFPSTQVARSIVINAPTAGFVLVSGAVSFQNTAETCTGFACGVFTQIRHSNSNSISPFVVVDVHGGTHPNATASATHVFPVAAGSNTFELRVARHSAAQSPSYFSPQLTGLFSAFGSSGGATLGELDIPGAEGGSPGGQ